MTNDELQQAIEANTIAISQISQALDAIVTQFIRPNTQQAFANYERLERIETVLENSAETIGQLEAIQAENAQQVAQNTQATKALAQIADTTQQQISSNAEVISQSESRLQRIENLTEENGNQIQVLIEEGRADRQSNERKFSEALAGIISNGRRISRLEQQAS
ncbi:MAG: hypothetical protein AB8B99_18405 [Phormidesmis sp.]